ncbi:MAG: hypothetical protein FJ399_09045 [Verrucomicrobia bacterium]|nr:hypothetical protein [Verrucomicrobiota bacterium]
MQVLTVAVLTAGVGWGAEVSRSAPGKATVSPGAQKAGAARVGSAKGPLPDPALLDGSTQAAEKKSEYGMIGDFELPGDENVRDGKVGGQQNPNAAAGGPQAGNQAMNLPQGGGGGGGPQAPQQGGQQGPQGGAQGQQGGAPGGEQIPQGSGQPGGAGQAGGPQNPAAMGNPVSGGDPGAQPQGIQVAELGGGASGQQGMAGVGGPSGRPPPVAIGDKAMRIEQGGASAQGAVGSQKQIADGHIQQHEKGTGTGGKGPTGVQGPGRVEKGRVVPAGL